MYTHPPPYTQPSTVTISLREKILPVFLDSFFSYLSVTCSSQKKRANRSKSLFFSLRIFLAEILQGASRSLLCLVRTGCSSTHPTQARRRTRRRQMHAPRFEFHVRRGTSRCRRGSEEEARHQRPWEGRRASDRKLLQPEPITRSSFSSSSGLRREDRPIMSSAPRNIEPRDKKRK